MPQRPPTERPAIGHPAALRRATLFFAGLDARTPRPAHQRRHHPLRQRRFRPRPRLFQQRTGRHLPSSTFFIPSSAPPPRSASTNSSTLPAGGSATTTASSAKTARGAGSKSPARTISAIPVSRPSSSASSTSPISSAWQQERQVISDIVHALNETSNLDQLLLSIHQSLKKVLYAENCFVALHNREADIFHFPFFADEFDIAPPPQKVDRTCTALRLPYRPRNADSAIRIRPPGRSAAKSNSSVRLRPRGSAFR